MFFQENIYSHNRIKRSRVCKPNTIYKVECNSCKCASDGQSYSCTLNECSDDADFSADINEDVEVFIEKDTKVKNYQIFIYTNDVIKLKNLFA